MELGQDRTVCELVSRLAASKVGEGVVKVAGTWGSFARLLAAHISERLGRPVLYVCPHIEDADKAVDDLRTFGASNVEQLPAWEGEEDLADATDEIRAERLRVALKLISGRGKLVIAASVQAICQPVPKPKALAAGCLRLAVEAEMSPEKLVEWLTDSGFERVERIDLPGQFARRGGIVDIYAPLISEKTVREGSEDIGESGSEEAQAVRIEFFGDMVESIREVNLDTQRSSGEIESIAIVSAVCGAEEEERELFLNILPEDTLVIVEEPADVEEIAKVYGRRAERPERLYSWEKIYEGLGGFAQLWICRFAVDPAEFLKVDIKSVQQFEHKATSVWAGHKAALDELVKEAKGGKKVYLYCESPAEIKRVREIIEQSEKRVPGNVALIHGYIAQGFVIDSLDTIVISHHELFGQFALRRRGRPIRASAPVESFEDLHEGDFVVHASYGIGKYAGIKTIQEKGGTSEYLTIEYDGGVTMQVSVRNIALIQKYIGTSPKRPKLSKIGSKRWQKQKDRVTKSVQDLAGELLEVQAQRQGMGGIAFASDSTWQSEFEESFAYQETPDQLTAVGQIKRDMQEQVAMDRLLCGDVGYGKTELAMRGAFKAVENGKQVAMLVPTTVLCVQHGRTFTERFADFPISIEVLNRFKTTKQARDIVARTKEGLVDILIGTHRLLSGDVGFKDLGLLVIDEEQRFGVEHKERLKRMRVNVDVLTMTATPIPRTLHMSLLGLRDISSLGTPPLDRRSIVTQVAAYNSDMIRKAIVRELNRQGQVFFVHNRVRTIDKKAWEIEKLLADTGARIAIAHGQMAKSELERAMIDFVTGETDVLVCTTIIESGLDIPNANTIFINDADRFGLAEMHQLRGRVGRYKHRAYAYMLLPGTRSITPIAAKRLKAIEEYSHLGAGFRIALRDLEIRGAGNILGAEQSGHIQLVGYQMYCELLAEAVRKMKDEPVEAIPTTALDLGFTSYIPRNYIPIDRQRMDVYRRVAVARSDEDLEQIKKDLADIYGPAPEEIGVLLELAELRIKASKRDIKSIVTSGRDLVLSFSKDADKHAAGLSKKVAGKVWTGDAGTVYIRLPESYFEPTTLMTVLRKILNRGGPWGQAR